MPRSLRRGGLRVRPGVETLDGRVLMAGNVQVSVLDGALTLRGDGLANSFAVTPGNAPGSYRIAGAFLAGSATRINGQPQLTVTGITGDVQILGRGGDDRINLNAGSSPGEFRLLEFPAGLTVDGGNGDDILMLNHMVVAGAFRFLGGAGNDTMRLSRSRLDGAATLQGNAGNDQMTILERTTFQAALTIDMGAGNDRVTASVVEESTAIDVTARGPVTVRLGDGNDVALVQRARFDAEARFFGDAGNDSFIASFSEFNGATSVDGGAGRDTLNALRTSRGNRFRSGDLSRISIEVREPNA